MQTNNNTNNTNINNNKYNIHMTFDGNLIFACNIFCITLIISLLSYINFNITIHKIYIEIILSLIIATLFISISYIMTDIDDKITKLIIQHQYLIQQLNTKLHKLKADNKQLTIDMYYSTKNYNNPLYTNNIKSHNHSPIKLKCH